MSVMGARFGDDSAVAKKLTSDESKAVGAGAAMAGGGYGVNAARHMSMGRKLMYDMADADDLVRHAQRTIPGRWVGRAGLATMAAGGGAAAIRSSKTKKAKRKS